MSEERRVEERRHAERRTQSLRAPGMGGLTPAKSMAATNPCLNCGTNVQLEFCPECGQRQIDPDPTLREFLHEAAEHFLGWDGKLAQSFRLLVTQPGFLTQEFLAGRRVRYLTPLRLYLTASVVYFFTLAIVPNVTPIKVETTRTATSAKPGPSRGKVAPRRAPNTIERGMERFGKNPAADQASIRDALPTLIFLLVPWFAYAVGSVYKRYRRHFPQHLVFALHAHAFMYVISVPLSLVGFARIPALNNAMVAIMLVATAVWTWIALRRVYGSTVGETTWKFARISLRYGLGLLIVMVGMVVVLLYRLGSA